MCPGAEILAGAFEHSILSNGAVGPLLASIQATVFVYFKYQGTGMSELEQNKLKTRRALELLFDSRTPFASKKEQIGNYINPKKYIQHSPGLADGLAGLMTLVEEFDDLYSDYSISVKRVVAEGDMTVAHCHYKFGVDDLGKAIVEIFRFENGLMVEHWDVIQDVPETEVTGNANGNGMF